MKGLASLFLGIFGTFAFSWVGLTLIPNWQIGHLNPQSDEEGTDIYPQPQSGMVERGARVYAANGCIYCHSQQVRADYAANDIERKWGDRRSAPRDYIFERPVFLGKMRMGQDIANIGARAPKEQESPAAGGAGAAAASPSPATSPGTAPAASPASPAPKAPTSAAPAAPGSPSPATATAANASPAASPSPAGAPWPVQTAGEPPMYSAAWQHVHLYSPRSINPDSNMPSYRFLYEKHRISDARSADALQLAGSDAPPEGWEVVPTFDAKCLVAYLMALNQSHPLKDVRSVGGAPATTPAPPPAAAGSSPGSPAPSK
ncbi:MAG TPA: cbb3-type cytochrome c oxidase subunit II [Planctomycetota bacterium]|nr:cbb3-type cytochrome c oxidase subunit II [Planctomycetota bacterium]